MAKKNDQKHALVTGASRGIGFEVVKKLLSEHFRVTGTARKSGFPDELRANDRFSGIHVDLENQDDIEAGLKPLFFEPNGIDILINNAGISVDADFSVNDEEWLNVWDRTQTGKPAILLFAKQMVR